MPYFYAVMDVEDLELTESVICAYFTTSRDTLCRGPHAGHVPYDQIAICFFVEEMSTFDKITGRLLPEGITFMDADGIPLDLKPS